MIEHVLPVLSIPSPPVASWKFFGLTIRAYALCIIGGVIVGTILATRRWIHRGGSRDAVETVALAAVPFGIVGARAYHVISDHQLYFGPGREPIHALFIWDGGLGIWGAVALGAVGVVGGTAGIVVACSDEHGNLHLEPHAPHLRLGDRVRLIPGHCDPTVNLHDWFVGVRDGRVEELWPITARGASR